MHAIPFQIFWTYIYEFRFPNLKIWDPFSGLKKWVQFSGLKFWGRNLEKIQGKNQKNFKVLKLFKIVPECPNVFWGVLFEKKNFAQCSKEGRVFEKIQKNQTNFQNSKKAQNIPKSVQTCFEHVFGQFVPTIFCPVFHGGSSLQKISKILKGPKSFAKVSKQVLNMSWGNFFEKVFLPSVPWRVEPSKFFQNSKKFNIPKLPKFVSKSVQTCFQHALGRFFRFF